MRYDLYIREDRSWVLAEYALPWEDLLERIKLYYGLGVRMQIRLRGVRE